ncbi:Amino acid ABC transporter membrane protein, PAAT family [Blastococcus saxobsidens DD2]|uniref:Amino acid ABC transporter membrane protein, PAAT family n=1 Tax=Blastococcus saxobsidens (strain DD2) TaxID=1146883 RepID=H6RX15_BLASD|nr:Amino acid ABC transporter membrane protein, PAAT family [Blastococcus saxobsidens DD2]
MSARTVAETLPSPGAAVSTAVPTATAPAGTEPTPPNLALVRRKHPWRLVSYGLLAVILAMLASSVVTNERWRWDVVGEYLFDEMVLSGLVTTIVLTVGAVGVGLVLGSLIAGMRLSSSRVLSTIAGWYIWFFRGVPVIVQVIFWVYLAQLYPVISLGIPFGPEFLFFDTNLLVAPVVGAIIGLSFNESAYLAEVLRGGIAAIPPGQLEAARAVGMTPGQIRRRVLAPQILPVVIPPFFNNVIAMTKTTAVVILASVTDLFSAVMEIGARNLQQTPLLLVATFWYLVLTAALTLLQMGIERLVARSATRR